MSNDTRRRNVIEALPGYDPEIGRWLWALEDGRLLTKEALAGIDSRAVDWMPPDGDNSIGTILYHLALIEADWLSVEVLEQASYPAAVAALLPLEDRDAHGRLTRLSGVGLDEHLGRLNAIREQVLAAFRRMTLAEFRRPRRLPDYEVTPEWVIHHLIQHEAEHRGQLGMLRDLAGAARAIP
jgi:uncharacterized damage-inducible protein DinB